MGMVEVQEVQGWDSECESYVERVASILNSLLGQALVGVYLHGSAAMNGFRRGRSDIDMLAISNRSLARAEKERIATALSQKAFPCPARELELSLVTQDVTRITAASPPYELHLSTGDCPHWIDGAERDGDGDLVAHFAMACARGRAIYGPPPQAVFRPVERPLLLQTLLSDLRWAEENATSEYRVLNACRCWRLIEDGSLGSKIEAGLWALSRTDDAGLVAAALSRQRGEEGAEMEAGSVANFVAGIMRRMERAIRE